MVFSLELCNLVTNAIAPCAGCAGVPRFPGSEEDSEGPASRRQGEDLSQGPVSGNEEEA